MAMTTIRSECGGSENLKYFEVVIIIITINP